MQSFMTDVCSFFVPVAVGLSIVAGMSYVNDQHILRMSANEPQLWMAQQAAAVLESTVATTTQLSGASVAIENSLAPYVVVYDSAGNPRSGTGLLHGSLPYIPAGIFDVTRSLGRDMLTWQPEPGVRQAIVVVPVRGGGGFVMSGRSLAYVEEQERALTMRSVLGFVAALAAALVASIGVVSFRRRSR